MLQIKYFDSKFLTWCIYLMELSLLFHEFCFVATHIKIAGVCYLTFKILRLTEMECIYFDLKVNRSDLKSFA